MTRLLLAGLLSVGLAAAGVAQTPTPPTPMPTTPAATATGTVTGTAVTPGLLNTTTTGTGMIAVPPGVVYQPGVTTAGYTVTPGYMAGMNTGGVVQTSYGVPAYGGVMQAGYGSPVYGVVGGGAGGCCGGGFAAPVAYSAPTVAYGGHSHCCKKRGLFRR